MNTQPPVIREHLAPAQVRRFLAGDCSEDEAVRFALHLDACPACTTAVAHAEPLSQAFASTDDPELPEGLARAALDQHQRLSRHRGTTEPSVAAGLLAAAVLVLAILGAPAELWSGLQGLGSALLTLARSVDAPVALLTPVWAAAALFTFASAAVAARRLEAGGPSWR